MEDELDETLFARWPEIYRGRHEPLSRNLMGFGFECRNGWFGILDALSSVLTTHARALDRAPPQALQVKEKFGTLRFYTHGDDAFDSGAIALAEEMSARVCETSGAPGRLSLRGGWYATFSPAAAAQKGFVAHPSADDGPLAPVPAAEIPRILAERWPTIVLTEASIPSGWYDIADALARRLSRQDANPKAPLDRRLALKEIDGALAIALAKPDPEDRGTVAMAIALAERIDPMTGCARIQ